MIIMKFYERPKQVVFADPENPGDWLAGIAFHDSIICSCCGGVFEIEDVIEQAKEDGKEYKYFQTKNLFGAGRIWSANALFHVITFLYLFLLLQFSLLHQLLLQLPFSLLLLSQLFF